jgi:hypothetical protein
MSAGERGLQNHGQQNHFLEESWWFGNFPNSVNSVQKTPNGWAGGEALTEARRHGRARYVNHEFFESTRIISAMKSSGEATHNLCKVFSKSNIMDLQTPPLRGSNPWRCGILLCRQACRVSASLLDAEEEKTKQPAFCFAPR